MIEAETALEPAAKFFNIGPISKCKATEIGIGNENYFVETPQGQFVLRRLWEQTVEGLQNEVAIQQQLQAGGLPTAILLRGVNGGLYFQSGDQVITGTKKIDGIHPEEIDESLAASIGTLQAKFHQVVKYLPIPAKNWLNREYVHKKVKQIGDHPLRANIEQRIQENEDIFDLDLPEGIIHGDLYTGNLLLTPTQELVVFDFETAEENLLILDIARTLLSIEKEAAFLDGYHKIRKLTEQETINLAKAKLYVSGAVAAWLVDRDQDKVAEEILHSAQS